MIKGINHITLAVGELEESYFLDPTGHKLEIHVGDLRSRLERSIRI